MAMVRQFVVKDSHNRQITALGYNPLRREILAGFEDGVIKSYDFDSGKLLNTLHQHQGWLTDFLYWPKMKLLLSSANDGNIVAWATNTVYDVVAIKQPVYCMAINPRRHQLICGVTAAINIYDLDEEQECGHIINPQVIYIAREHTDVVRCLLCHDSRVYSAGYDQKMIIYDSSYTGEKKMKAITENKSAHNAGIVCLSLVRDGDDNENNTWIVTGSFDKTMKIWSQDGKLVHPPLEGFNSTVSGICYVPENRTIWAAGGAADVYLFDPKSGDNVTDFVGSAQPEEEDFYSLQLLKYFRDTNQVVGTTNRRNIIVWKYNSSGCMSTLRNDGPFECLAYTRKIPILIFSGDSEGVIAKLERMQSNHFMYSKETFHLNDAKKTALKKQENFDEKLRKEEETREKELKNEKNNFLNMPMVNEDHLPKNTTIMDLVFVEDLDLIIAACEDSNIYTWGFDEEAVQVLKSMREPQEMEILVRKYAILLDHTSKLVREKPKNPEEDSVTNRVAGFVCKHIFSEHRSCVTSLAVIGRQHGFDCTYLVSAGWDRQLFIWDIEEGNLHSAFSDGNEESDRSNLACDEAITSIAYCPPRNEIAYSSSDHMVYIRRFSPDGSDMPLLNTLQGHFREVTKVVWNPIRCNWVTGSEDGTIRIWEANGMNDCEEVFSHQRAVTALCIDKNNGAIVAGIGDLIRVYHKFSAGREKKPQYNLVQVNRGHTDAVKSIIHIQERDQYVSASWDKTIRIWNASTRTTDKEKHETEEKDTKDSDHVTSKSHVTSASHVTEDQSEAGTLSEDKSDQENTSSRLSAGDEG